VAHWDFAVDAGARAMHHRETGGFKQMPYQMIIMVPVLAFAGYMMMRNMKRMKGWESSMAHYRAGELAPRVGMQLVNGDPSFNVATTNVGTVAKKYVGSKYDAEFHLQMVGQPYGHQTEFSIDYVIESNIGSTVASYFGAIHMKAAARVPRFELYRRISTMGNLGLSADAMGAVQHVYDDANLPKVQFGDPMLDQRYVLQSEDPSIGPRIAQALQIFGTLDFVHIYSNDGGVTFRASTMMQNMTWMNFEQVLYGVACVVSAIEGRPLPAQMAMAQGPQGLPAPQGVIATAPPVPQGFAQPQLGQVPPLAPGQQPMAYPPQQQPMAFGQAPQPPQGYAQPPQGYAQPPYGRAPRS